MAKRGGNGFIWILSLLCLSLIYHFEATAAADFTVGDAGGWTFNVNNWPNGKSFKAGDVLVFNYASGAHNVVVVDEAGYDGCTAGSGKVFTSGSDRITLAKGDNFFICSFPAHCSPSNMKIKVTAS